MKEKAILLLRLVHKLETKGIVNKKHVKKNLNPQIMEQVMYELKTGTWTQ
jgi:hypothetical protein